MIYDREGAVCYHGGREYRVGDRIVANAESPWEGLYGTITEIRDGDDRDTENDTLELYCSFLPPIHPDEISRVEKRFSAVRGTETVLENIPMDMVIMAPEMIWSLDRNVEDRKITIYLVREEWVLDYDGGVDIYLFADHDQAKMTMLRMVHEDMVDGCISRWRGREDLESEIKVDSYEFWLHDSYHENHYQVSLTTQELYLSAAAVRQVADMHTAQCSLEDFISHIEGWDEVSALTEEQYQAFIADPRIPEMIQSKLSKNEPYFESYWESVSECAHQLLREYLMTIHKPGAGS